MCYAVVWSICVHVSSIFRKGMRREGLLYFMYFPICIARKGKIM